MNGIWTMSVNVVCAGAGGVEKLGRRDLCERARDWIRGVQGKAESRGGQAPTNDVSARADLVLGVYGQVEATRVVSCRASSRCRDPDSRHMATGRVSP